MHGRHRRDARALVSGRSRRYRWTQLLHPTVYERLALPSVRNYSSYGKYRPAPLLNHHKAREYFEEEIKPARRHLRTGRGRGHERMARKRRTRPATVQSANAVQEFERELEVLRTEAETVAQFFYAYLDIHACAGAENQIYRLLNTAPLFWNTILGGLQTAAFVVLGQISIRIRRTISADCCASRRTIRRFSQRMRLRVENKARRRRRRIGSKAT